MKKFLLIVALASLFVACEKEGELRTPAQLSETLLDNRVSEIQALLIAEEYVSKHNQDTRSNERKVKSTELYVAKPATRSADDVEVSFYLVNYENNAGYAVVSTDNRTTPVYAFSDTGNISADDFDNNPGLSIFMEGAIGLYEQEVASARGIDAPFPIIIPNILYNTNDRVEIVEENGVYYYKGYAANDFREISPMLTTLWNQGAPYNKYCDNGYAGCGPIAVAQIMAYHKYPADLLDWDRVTETSILLEVSIGADDLASLIKEIGVKAEARYLSDGTYTYVPDLKTTFEEYGYNCHYSTGFSQSSVINNIEQQRPLLISGFNGTEGHAWVIDGYRRYASRVTYYYTTSPYNVYREYTNMHTFYAHCAWGLPLTDASTSNGFYLYNAFDYTQNTELITNITPANL